MGTLLKPLRAGKCLPVREPAFLTCPIRTSMSNETLGENIV